MAEQQARRSRQREEQDDQPEAPDQSEKKDKANEVSAVTEDVLEDIDRVLKAQCGFDEDESVSDEEFEQRAEVLVRNYQQKGGQ
jgi:outer membrane protein OmpA-like peptidoglycan-associated protein